MNAFARVTLAAASLGFGAIWLVSAASKLAAPLPSYEFTVRLAEPGREAKALLALAVAGETLLGAAMVLRVVRGYWASLVGLALASTALVVVRSHAGGQVPCGCFAALLDTSVDQALTRNAVLAAILVALIAWDSLASRAAAPPSPTAS